MSCNSESSFFIVKYSVLCALKELLNWSVLAPVTTASVKPKLNPVLLTLKGLYLKIDLVFCGVNVYF